MTYEEKLKNLTEIFDRIATRNIGRRSYGTHDFAEAALDWMAQHPSQPLEGEFTTEGFYDRKFEVLTPEDKAVIEAAERCESVGCVGWDELIALAVAVRARREAMKPKPRYEILDESLTSTTVKIRDNRDGTTVRVGTHCDAMMLLMWLNREQP